MSTRKGWASCSGRGIFVAALVVSVASAPAMSAADETEIAQTRVEDATYDPIEPVNRFIFGANQILEQTIFGMVASLYNAFLPPPVRQAIGNVIDNIHSPVILANDLLQLEFARAGNTIGRFAINSTLGIAGMFDPAAAQGMPEHDEDFGQTLGVWGVGEMFYIVLPVFGPSNPRDAVGKHLVDPYFDPLSLWLKNSGRDDARWARNGVEGVDAYASVKDELEKIRKTSIDYYATIRSMYRQKREAEIRNGDPDSLPPIPDYDLVR